MQNFFFALHKNLVPYYCVVCQMLLGLSHDWAKSSLNFWTFLQISFSVGTRCYCVRYLYMIYDRNGIFRFPQLLFSSVICVFYKFTTLVSCVWGEVPLNFSANDFYFLPFFLTIIIFHASNSLVDIYMSLKVPWSLPFYENK